MHRTQIYLDEDQYELLRSRARREGKSLAAIVREILDAHLGLSDRSTEDPLREAIGIGRGDGKAVAEHYEDYLYGEES